VKEQVRDLKLLADKAATDENKNPAQALKEYEDATALDGKIGRGDAIRRTIRQSLDQPYDVVTEISNRPAPELTERGHFRWTDPADKRRQILDWIRWPPRIVPASFVRPILDHAIFESPRAARLSAEKGVTRPRFAAGGSGFQQKGERISLDLRKRRHRRIGVEQAILPHRDEGRSASSLPELLEAHESALRPPAAAAATNFPA